MAAKKKKQPNLRSRILNLILEQGPRPQKGMTKILAAYYQSLNSEILELRNLGVLEKSDDGVLSLVQGVDLAQFGIQVPSSENRTTAAKINATESSMPSWRDGDFTHQEKFVRLLRSVGVKTATDVIAELFFSGDVDSLHWLYEVLMVTSKGFVTENQAKLIMPSWATYWGLSFDFDEFFGG